MRPITVSVGPLASASANNICTSQTPSIAGQLAINGTLASYGFQGTGSISGNVLVISGVTSGVLVSRQPIIGLGVLVGTFSTANLLGTGGGGTYIVNRSQTVSSTTIYGNAVATLDTPRRILITTSANESANTFRIDGTDYNGFPIYELVTGPNASTAYTNMDFATVTSVSISGAASGTVTIGTNGVASSQWVKFDEFASAQVFIQATATGTVNFTLQQTGQDHTASSYKTLPYQVVWVNTSDTNGVNATGTVQSYYTNAPVWAKVTLNSGSGSVQAVYSQLGSVPY